MLDACRLVVNADDFGFSPGVNRGILQAHRAGVVSSVSTLVNTPGWTDAIHELEHAGPALGVGLHLNLTAGEPLSDARTLRDRRTGRFYPPTTLGARACTGQIDPREVANECAAQLARLRGTGVAVTHLDSHHHVHALPGVWQPVIATARESGVRVVRVPLEPLSMNPLDWRALLKKAALATVWRVASRHAAPLGHVDRFVGLSLEGGTAFLPRLLAVLDGLGPGTTELMVHPGYADGELAGWDTYTTPRATELAALLSEPVRARFQSGRFQLINFASS
jgi:predicted glycoside hydrolase/deacetylase ChbG (UPF0249 family)